MTITDRIQQGVQQLPKAMQAEVLDFVQRLLTKAERGHEEDDHRIWNEMSLSSAMRGMEDENEPHYSEADLKVTFL
ncbi:MAG: hypothetical protein HYX92_09790 [Chloroflexi bacterium]|nr:hypothetical protein [Chloroflexota bacterium]